MIRSMTGYGTAAITSDAVRGAVSVRAVNHRFLDTSVHLSRRLSALEGDVKRSVQQRLERGRVEVSVRDDGVGFDTTAAPASTYGLMGMRFRVEAEGGAIALQSAPGQGTCVQAWLPRVAPDKD